MVVPLEGAAAAPRGRPAGGAREEGGVEVAGTLLDDALGSLVHAAEDTSHRVRKDSPSCEVCKRVGGIPKPEIADPESIKREP